MNCKLNEEQVNTQIKDNFNIFYKKSNKKKVKKIYDDCNSALEKALIIFHFEI